MYFSGQSTHLQILSSDMQDGSKDTDPSLGAIDPAFVIFRHRVKVSFGETCTCQS
jgi:hypothetical protein